MSVSPYHLNRTLRVTFGTLSVAVAIALLWMYPDAVASKGGYLLLGATVLAYAIATFGLTSAMGWCGLFIVSQGATMGIAAYVFVLLMNRGWPGLSAVVLALCAAIGLSVVTGLFGSRIRTHYFLILTLGVQLIFTVIVSDETTLTGGANGLALKRSDIAGFNFDGGRSTYELCVVCMAVVSCAFWALHHSREGRAMRALRQTRPAAEASGVPVVRMHLVGMTVFGVCSGVSGILIALLLQYISPDSYSLSTSLAILVYAVFGGLGSTVGAFLGTVFFQFIQFQYLTSAAGYSTLIYGGLLIIAMLYLPGGLTGICLMLYRRARGFSRGRNVENQNRFTSSDQGVGELASLTGQLP